jgi:hypothetical protein
MHCHASILSTLFFLWNVTPATLPRKPGAILMLFSASLWMVFQNCLKGKSADFSLIFKKFERPQLPVSFVGFLFIFLTQRSYAVKQKKIKS